MAATGIDETRLRRAFLEEAEELSQKLGDSLLALESDRENGPLVNEVFRLTHSLKSESALMGFVIFSTLAHGMEDVLGFAREGKLILEKPVMEQLFAGADLISEMVAAIAKGGSDADFATEEVRTALAATAGTELPAAKALAAEPDAAQVDAPRAPEDGGSSLLALGDAGRRQLAEARDRGENAYRLVLAVDEAESMKFPRAFLVFSNLELVANVVKVTPAMEGTPHDDALYGRTTMLLTAAGEEAIRAAAAVDQITITSVERLDFAALLALAAETRGVVVDAGGGSPGRGEQPAAVDGALRAGPVEKTTIRVDTRKLDDLWSLIAELVMHKLHIARLSEDLGRSIDVDTAREELAESFDSLDKISSGMQQAMMDTRMIPIAVIFSKFPRLVRDLSRKLGKNVALALAGEDTEIDRGLVEALSEPLTHIIRNSLDHGIEFPEERVRRGKDATGRVTVAARRQGGMIAIEVSDDGRGMDVEAIRRKALSLGVADAETFTETQLLELVFLPGFSTKEVVTDLSGRGVGMDVVATRIRGGLKGDVLLRTEQGRGTRTTLLLPLTLTIVNALLVRGDSQLYAIPLTDIDSTAKLLTTEMRGEEGRETSIWEEEDIPVHSLGALFGNGRHPEEEFFAVVLRHGDRKAFLVVDELIEEREIVIKPVDDLLNAEKLFSGVSVLEDGRLVFILDTSFIRRENF